jgi:hypothetical protein
VETKGLSQEQLLHENGLLEFDKLHLHKLQLGNFSVELRVEFVTLGLLGEEVELGCGDNGIRSFDVSDPNLSLLLELDSETHVIDLLAINKVDVHIQGLFLVRITEVDAGELPVGNQEATLLRGNGAGAEAIGILGKGLAVKQNISVTT